MFFIAFYQFVFLRTTLPPRYPVLNISIMILLLFADVAASLMLFLLYEHEAKFQFPMIPFIFIYPFTVILSPIMALTSVFICKASFYRIFLNLNALTCVTNVFLTLVVEIIYSFSRGEEGESQLRSTQVVEPIIILVLKIFVKVAISHFACKQMAFNENSSFYFNKRVLDSVSKMHQETTDNGSSDMYKQNSDNDTVSNEE